MTWYCSMELPTAGGNYDDSEDEIDSTASLGTSGPQILSGHDSLGCESNQVVETHDHMVS